MGCSLELGLLHSESVEVSALGLRGGLHRVSCRPPLNPNVETSTDSECSSLSSNEYPMEITHTTNPAATTLAPGGVLDQIQGLGPEL